MIKLEDSNESFYFCTTANWSTIVLAVDENEAAKEALESENPVEAIKIASSVSGHLESLESTTMEARWHHSLYSSRLLLLLN